MATINVAEHWPPHSLRHSGPSHKVIRNECTLEEIRRRGRWKSPKSVQRYTKTHTLLARRVVLGPDRMAQGAALWKRLPLALAQAASEVKGDFAQAVMWGALRAAKLHRKPRSRATPRAK